MGHPNSNETLGVPLEVPQPVAGCGIGFDTGRPHAEEPGGSVFQVEPTSDGHWLTFGKSGPDLSAVRPGHQVFMSSHPSISAEARAATQSQASGMGRIPVVLTVAGRMGEPLRATLMAQGPIGRETSVAEATEETLSQATGEGLTVDLLRENWEALAARLFI
jgi:hypothetical protein